MNAASPDWQQIGSPYIWMPYCQMQSAPVPLPVVRTEDVYLILADGRRLIDGMASWWSACHGYNHPHITQAVAQQLQRMPHVMFGGIHHEPALTLARRLAGLLPGDLNRVFFSDSGSVAVEVAMKMAVQFWRNQGQVRNRFVSFHNAYHGDTTGAMSLCDPQRSMHTHFRGFLLEQFCREMPRTQAEFAEFDRFLQSQRQEIAAVFIEPLVQGAGGMRFHEPETVAFLRQACDRHDVLLIADELATGFGRTGSLFAVEQAAVVPDIICLGKALTGGTMGLAATVASDRVFNTFLSDDPAFALMHGPTFMANPLACAAANASLDLFDSEPRLEQARAIEAAMMTALEPCRAMSHIVDVRCQGAIGVVQVDELYQVDRLRQRFVDEGVWIRPFGDVIYITPPLCITVEQLAELCEAMVRVVFEWSQWKCH